MPQFRYEARTAENQSISGVMQAEDERAVVAQLVAMGHMVTAVKRERVAPLVPPRSGIFDRLFFRARTKDLAFFSRQMAHLLGSGMSVGEALTLLQNRVRSPKLRTALMHMGQRVQDGAPLSGEMRQFPTLFPESLISMVEVGEASGDLAGMFEQAAHYLDNEHKIRSKISLYTFYPKALLVFALLISTVRTLCFQGTGAWLVQVATMAAHIGIPLVVLWIAFRIALGYPAFAHGYDRLKLAIPWFGGVIRKFCGARFCRCLGYLYHAGVPITAATGVGAKSCGNLHMRDRLLGMTPLLQQGAPISDVLARSGQFPAEVIHMAAAGERSGDLDSLLAKVADYMEEEADASANKAVLLSLPLSVILIGFIVVLRLAMGMLMGSDYVRTIQQMTQ